MSEVNSGVLDRKPEALLLLGPTASGKSALALELARKYPLEIISIDSALVYRGMDIGSAKPTKEELAAAPHHLIDIREINEPYSAADFVEDCVRLVPEIRARGRIPLIAGGTMLYAKALREGIDEMPTTSPEVREGVAAEAERIGWPAMHKVLAECDPVTAARLAPNDRQRIGRALEVYRMTGRPLSSFHRREPRPALPLVTAALVPSDRAALHRRIELRFDQMLEAGFVDEVKGLMARPDFDAESPAMRAVGYRQAIEYLEGKRTFEEFRLAGIAATRQLAKRQLTWLRSMTDVERVDPLEPGAFEKVEALLRRVL
ncbi:tRNA (adenosine(37)-N6)-dimethylallyltransferase MiaA [Sutterella sp.]|uniref:tRNA (adenosine(37)-N6)-dimethylallyltransferase MiaA n=1 Tax=Sutterella sp. TaxID=1981025 RepID=UPI0026E019CD|nr:tRNA (adenosine(37)-N6)-dimethylallyltransferase MiaA [Sutterella sp.]MDO5531756.1 tRNA (adenosine(37)-N6)-dimethylallyltransferase MiaA [Sutterella sp.]